MVGNNAVWYLDIAAVKDVARRRLQEEERLLWNFII